MTRFEKLKEMTVEEIAEWWTENIDCGGCPVRFTCIGGHHDDGILNHCATIVKNYLNSQVEPKTSCAIDFGEEE